MSDEINKVVVDYNTKRKRNTHASKINIRRNEGKKEGKERQDTNLPYRKI